MKYRSQHATSETGRIQTTHTMMGAKSERTGTAEASWQSRDRGTKARQDSAAVKWPAYDTVGPHRCCNYSHPSFMAMDMTQDLAASLSLSTYLHMHRNNLASMNKSWLCAAVLPCRCQRCYRC